MFYAALHLFMSQFSSPSVLLFRGSGTTGEKCSVVPAPQERSVIVARLCIQDESKATVQLSKKDAAQC
jgi:hypothetical protein